MTLQRDTRNKYFIAPSLGANEQTSIIFTETFRDEISFYQKTLLQRISRKFHLSFLEKFWMIKHLMKLPMICHSNPNRLQKDTFKF